METISKALELKNLSHKSNLKGSRASCKQKIFCRDNDPQNTWGKL